MTFLTFSIVTGLFTQLIPSAEFGTVTVGQNVKVEIGGRSNLSISGKPYTIPATQTDLRVKMTLINAIQTGVSIRRMV